METTINVGLFPRPNRLPGLQVGGSIYHDQISDFTRGQVSDWVKPSLMPTLCMTDTAWNS